MSTDAASLPNDVAQLQATSAQQLATIAALQRELDGLKHFVAQLLRQRYGRRSERIDPAQLVLFEAPANEALTAASEISSPEDAPTTIVATHRRRGGRGPLPADLPRQRIEHDLSEREKCCPGCGQLRQRIGCETSEQLEFVPASLYVIEHVRWKYACRACQEHVALAPRPAKPLDKSLPGAGLLAAVAVGKYCDHLPLYRLEDVFARHGVALSRGTLCRWARAGAKRLRPLYELLIERVRASRIIWTDDTPMPVLDAALDRTRTGRLWVYCGDAQNPYSVYDYTPSRKRDGPLKFLQDFTGYLQADAFAGYDGIYAARSVEQVLCWAHARRKFYEAKAAHPEGAHQALAWIARLYELERAAKGLPPDERLALRQQRSLPLLRQFRDWLASIEPRVLPKSPLGQALGYVLPRWDGLTRYCQDGELSIDNNLSERTIRPCTIGRNYVNSRIMSSGAGRIRGFWGWSG